MKKKILLSAFVFVLLLPLEGFSQKKHVSVSVDSTQISVLYYYGLKIKKTKIKAGTGIVKNNNILDSTKSTIVSSPQGEGLLLSYSYGNYHYIFSESIKIKSALIYHESLIFIGGSEGFLAILSNYGKECVIIKTEIQSTIDCMFLHKDKICFRVEEEDYYIRLKQLKKIIAIKLGFCLKEFGTEFNPPFRRVYYPL